MKYLDAAVERVHHKNPVVMVDKQPRRQLELSRMRTLGAEVVEQLTLAVENLHHPPQSIHHVKIAFRVNTDRLRPEHGPGAVADLSNGVLERSGAVKHLHTEVHGIYHHQIRPVQPEFGGQIELALTVARLADGLQHPALHVKYEHLVAQRVGAAESTAIPVGRLK